jgi:hypothetical protein
MNIPAAKPPNPWREISTNGALEIEYATTNSMDDPLGLGPGGDGWHPVRCTGATALWRRIRSAS